MYKRIRLWCADNKATVDQFTGEAPKAWFGTPLRFEIGLGKENSDLPRDISDLIDLSVTITDTADHAIKYLEKKATYLNPGLSASLWQDMLYGPCNAAVEYDTGEIEAALAPGTYHVIVWGVDKDSNVLTFGLCDLLLETGNPTSSTLTPKPKPVFCDVIYVRNQTTGAWHAYSCWNQDGVADMHLNPNPETF